MDIITNNKVAVGFLPNEDSYPAQYGPDSDYPEFMHYRELLQPTINNSLFKIVRQMLLDIGLDRDNYGSVKWNPIGTIVKENANVLLKPNWVLHEARNGSECLLTHQSIIHAIIPYVLLANPKKIIIGDAPLQYCDFDKLMKEYDFKFFHDKVTCDIEIKDFRRTITSITDNYWTSVEHCRPTDDYCEVNIGRHSLLEPIAGEWKRFRVTVYDPRLMWKHHYAGCHKYLVSRDILDADLVINLPKLKTHQKAGITCCLKNLIGINGNKEYLPHHRKGGSAKGGDAFRGSSILLGLMENVWDVANKNKSNPLIFNALFRLASKIKAVDEKLGGSGRAEGSWFGNDTLWRTCLDLNRVLLYCANDGSFSDNPVRSLLNLVDAIVVGQGDGPLDPEPLYARMLLGGVNPAATDWVAAAMLGFDPRKIPTIINAFRSFELPIVAFSPHEIELIHDSQLQILDEFVSDRMISAKPAKGWENHIEADSVFNS